MGIMGAIYSTNSVDMNSYDELNEKDKLKDLVQSHEELINTNDVTNEDHLSKIISLENILKIKTNDLIDIKNNMIKFKENETIKFNSEKDAYESELLLMINKIKALEKINENNEKIIKFMTSKMKILNDEIIKKK